MTHQQTITFDPDDLPGAWTDAVDLASDQDTITWITDPDGKRAAAIVPVADAEFVEEKTRGGPSMFAADPSTVYPCHHPGGGKICHPVAECQRRGCAVPS